jgi:succinyl-diaminopimelate desuccinylase
VPSVSGDEGALADAVEAALRELPQFEVVRCGDAVLARTHLGRERRVLLAGHLDTVPIADNLPSRRDGTLLYGCGTSGSWGLIGVLHIAASVAEPHTTSRSSSDLRGGRGRAQRARPHRAGCRTGSPRTSLLGEPPTAWSSRVPGHAAGRGPRHRPPRAAARSWLGDNAVHRAAEVLNRLAAYDARRVRSTGASTARACKP